MYKIFLYILLIQRIRAGVNEKNLKYIDLLSEEDKQEFLNRIARRILEEVKNPDIPNESHAEVNEEQLEAQDSYIKQIIREESKNLQNEKGDDVKIDDETNIDLTLRAGNREETNNSEHLATSELKVLPVKNIQENVESGDRSVNNSKSKAINDKDNKTGFYNGVENDLVTNNSNHIQNISIIRKSYDNQLFRTTMSNYDPSSEENTLATEDKIIASNSTLTPDNYENTNKTETTDEIIWISTQKIFDDETKSDENINSESTETQSSSVLPPLSNSTSVSEKIKLENTTSQTPIHSSHINQTNNKNETNVHLYLRSEERDLKKDSNTTHVTNNVLSDLERNENNMNSTNKISNDTISVSNMINANKSKSSVSSNKSSYLIDNTKKNVTYVNEKQSHVSNLRANSASREYEIYISPQKLKFKSDGKEYEVFEVVGDKPPFVMSSNTANEDSPDYIPVYNYAPNYAYFNPSNRFEPITDDRDSDVNYETNKFSKEDVNQIPNIRSIFSGYHKKDTIPDRYKPEGYIIKKQRNNIFGYTPSPNINNFQNIYYNPDDYLDIDYYFGRTNINRLRSGPNEIDDIKGLPDSDDEDHPYNSIHKSDKVKDHIRAVRKVLYLNQIFGPLPERNKNERKFYDMIIKNQGSNTKPNIDDIAIDYYFGRTPNHNLQGDSLNKLYKNNLFKKPLYEENRNTNKYDDKLNEFIINVHKMDNKLKVKLDEAMKSMLEVLRDFIRFDNEALSKYNWLESTIDVLGAIKKLLNITTRLQFGEHIYPKDLELLKYTLYLYKSCLKINEKISEKNESELIKRKKGLLPKNKWKNRISKPLKLWKDVAFFIRNKNSKQNRLKLLYDFEDFLQNLLFFLHDFYDAIKNIAIITKYNNQKWYEDLKNIYLNGASDENLLKLLLHLSVTKIFDSIEKSSTEGAEDSFRIYIRNNREYVKRSQDEFKLVFNILNELRRLNKNNI